MLLKKLIIAEDDDAIAHLVAASLGDAGFLCLRAWDGEEAINLVRSELPDLLVLDVMMPKLDGIDVCRRLKSDVLLSRVPILMLTSLADINNKVEGLEAGADDYLAKPFDLREVAARVKALIRQSRRERDRNPTTNLPGTEAIEDRVAELLRDRKAFTLLYVDIDNFRTFADVYGYRQADDVVCFTGKLILSQCRAVGDPVPFVGHVGGDDFIIVCEDGAGAQRLRDDIAAVFREGIQDFYTEEDRERGCVLIKTDSGDTRSVQLMEAHTAMVEIPPGKYETTEALAREVTRVKAETRKRTAGHQS